MIDVFLGSPWWGILAGLVWLISALVGLVVLITRRDIDHTIELMLTGFFQWWVVITTLTHLGFEHGWTLHMISERMVIGFGVAGIANLYTYTRLLKK